MQVYHSSAYWYLLSRWAKWTGKRVQFVVCVQLVVCFQVFRQTSRNSLSWIKISIFQIADFLHNELFWQFILHPFFWKFVIRFLSFQERVWVSCRHSINCVRQFARSPTTTKTRVTGDGPTSVWRRWRKPPAAWLIPWVNTRSSKCRQVVLWTVYRCAVMPAPCRQQRDKHGRC